MTLLLISVFVPGYAAIAFEHPLKIDKAAFALITGIVLWIDNQIHGNGKVQLHLVPEENQPVGPFRLLCRGRSLPAGKLPLPYRINRKH